MHRNEEYRFGKAARIAEIIVANMHSARKLCIELVKHTRKMPRIKSKRIIHADRIKHKRTVALIRYEIVLNQLMSSTQIGVILSQPIPKFPPGGNISTRGPAIVGESGKEIIIHPTISYIDYDQKKTSNTDNTNGERKEQHGPGSPISNPDAI